ncbi:sensor domain-containing diguanylate cyclase [uncultured Clostridium sp.]|jgi:diguanylate cyclase (GGDEF)-like protein|uniref:sensor domain-containing diguanylate cyclase n=1 Tax=uncultured Clostridium sp. TaxID=59620 RepID=UPI00260DA359|nr:sensor domain-containing diguanylate cyclase [uncultured Clostridium sp.]
MENYEELYKQLNREFHSYQLFAEERLQKMNRVNKGLERKLSIFENIVEVSKYINSNISDSNLLGMINDMIVGMLGVSYSTIHLIENDILVPKTTNIGDLINTKIHYRLEEIKMGKSFIKNDNNGIFSTIDGENKINSLIGVPICIKEKLTGYIIVEHMYYTFFEKEDVNFIEYIAHQVAIAIENSSLYKKIQEAAQRDSLLDICNRKYFYELIEIEKKNNEECKGFAIVMCDIDNFKNVNDTYGHQIGDLVLKSIVRIMKENLRESDIIARYGGEEIIIFLSGERSREETIAQVETMRAEIESNIVKSSDDGECSVTVSFGVGFTTSSNEDGLAVDKIIKRADDKLYVAKRTGKNKVEY